MKKLIKTLHLPCTITLLTGLHIGSGKDRIQIGGLDQEVIKHPHTGMPPIPGSSLKGKIRSLLEIARGKELEKDEEINTYFGRAAKRETTTEPTRLLFRDFSLTETWQREFEERKRSGKLFFEEKTEISIDRKSGTVGGSGVRQFERVPSGVAFVGEIVVRIFEGDSVAKAQELLQEGFAMLEDDALGGSGSRGYGQVKITPDWSEFADAA